MILWARRVFSRQGIRDKGEGKRKLFCMLLAGWLLASCSLPGRSVTVETTSVLPETPISSEVPASPTEPSPKPASPTPLTSSTSQPVISPTPTLQATPDNRYQLKVFFDYAQQHLDVEEHIAYHHAVLEPISQLVFLVEPNRYPGSFQLGQLSWGNGDPVESYALKNNRLEVTLPQPIDYGEEIALTITYSLDLPEIPPPADDSRPQPYGYTSRQTNLVDWYPVLPPYKAGEGWLAHDPGYFGEHQVYQSADYQVEIELARPLPADLPLVIAASVPAEIDGNLYRYEVQKARNFAWSASNVYTVSSTQVGDITVLSYTFPFSGDGGEAALQYAAEAVKLYSQLYGHYPGRSLSIVEADFLDGMEYEGLFFLSRGFYNLYDGTPDGYLTAIAVHETAHQWWYGSVGNDQALEPWLDEALCTYSEKLFYENTYPELLDWWWAFRVRYYQPEGYINGSIYDYNGFMIYRNAVYLRGAEFLESLRQAVGDEAFFAFLKDYAAQNMHGLAAANSFFTILEQHSPVDIQPLLQEYFK